MDNNEFEKDLENTEGENEESSNVVNEDIGIDSSEAEKKVEGVSNTKPTSFYSESYKKPGKNRGSNVFQLIIVALISSVIGGGVFAGIMFLTVPSLSASKNSDEQAVVSNTSQGYKQVKIEATDSPVAAIAEKVGPSIVGIKVTFTASNLNSFFGSQSGVGEGSGIIVRSDGYIVTNNHVVADAVNDSTGKVNSSSKIEVILPNNPKKSYPAQLVARDSKSDLAVLKINLTGLPAAELGDSDKIKVGELAVAIGSPGGLDYMNSVTSGIISGLNRDVTDNSVGMKYIQTDAPINSGNSGGALLNSQGQVIGINTLKADTQSGYEGLGFAIPINQAKPVIESLITNKYVTGRPPILNLTANTDYTSDVAKANGWPEGVYVDSVTPFGAAYVAGIRDNDIITKFDGKTIKTYDDLTSARNKHKAGDKVSVEVYRDKAYKTFTITLQQDKS